MKLAKQFIKTRRKILFVSEASFAATGFGTIYNELISRFYNDGRFRVAEFATDTHVDDARDSRIPWRLYPNSVYSSDKRHKEFSQNANNRFGSWRFEQVCLDFEPDIVIDLRDPPFFQFQHLSCLRPYFHWCIGPTVDSSPQPVEWVEMFLDADSVMPYTEFGQKTIEEEHPDVNIVPGLGPGINLDVFQPRNQKRARQEIGLSPDIKLLGYVSRNQQRKLMPELLEAFSQVLNEQNSKEYFLHLHTATPDLKSWNIPKLLIETNTYNNVLFTYMCLECGCVFLSYWQGSVCNCHKCNEKRAIHPRSGIGVDQEIMAKIFNCYDLYIQYSNCEGLGIGALEAAASGVPFMAVDYSAMQSLNENLGGIPIPFDLMRDITVDAKRAVPKLDETVKLIKEYMGKPKSILAAQGARVREQCEEKYNWNDIAKRWMDFCERVELTGIQGQWGKINQQQLKISPTNKSAMGSIKDALRSADRQDLEYTHYIMELYARYELSNFNLAQNSISKEDIENIITNMANTKIGVDKINQGECLLPKEDFLEYADIKELAGLRRNPV